MQNSGMQNSDMNGMPMQNQGMMMDNQTVMQSGQSNGMDNYMQQGGPDGLRLARRTT